jgi:uncharacterized protein (DUF934 family)
MPTLIRWKGGVARAEPDTFSVPAEDEPLPAGDVILSWTRFQAEGERLWREGRRLGLRLAPAEDPLEIAPFLPHLYLVALEFPKFRDGRPYSAARLLRERLGWHGQLRAVGDVLLEQAPQMIRCGFDAFQPADGSGPESWTRAGARFAFVYQRAADHREPAFALRAAS